jgi:type I restriction enzyme S subunit
MERAEWRTVPIRELYEGLYDGPHATPKPSSSGPVFLGIKNVTDDGQLDLSEIRHIDEDDYPTWTRRVEPRAGDLVFTYEATLNRYAIVPEDFRGCLGRRMALIRPDPRKVDVRFLLYYFFTDSWRAVIKNNLLTGATVDRIPLTNFPEFPINIPPLTVQRRIAETLSAYDQLIENNQRRIRILETMARALYREWFVHFRFPGHEKLPRVASPLGDIPQGWEVTTYGDLYNTSSGGTPSRKHPDYFEGGSVDWVKSQELLDRFILSPEERITEEALENSSAKVFPANTVLVALYGATIGKLGILAREAATNQACCAVLPKRSPFGREFAFLTLRLNRERIIGLRLGAAQQNISQVLLRTFECVKPSDELVSQFSERAAPLFDGILTLQRQIQNLRRTRDLLLPRLLSAPRLMSHNRRG